MGKEMRKRIVNVNKTLESVRKINERHNLAYQIF